MKNTSLQSALAACISFSPVAPGYIGQLWLCCLQTPPPHHCLPHASARRNCPCSRGGTMENLPCPPPGVLRQRCFPKDIRCALNWRELQCRHVSPYHIPVRKQQTPAERRDGRSGQQHFRLLQQDPLKASVRTL